MKHTTNFINSLPVLLMISMLTVLIASCGGLGSTESPPQVVQSPQALPNDNAPTALPPMIAKATVAAMGAKYTPQPTQLYSITSSQDVINIVLNDPGFLANLDDPIFGPYSKGAAPGEPIFVKSISPSRWDYYLVPFYKDGKLSGLAIVRVKDGKGRMGGWRNASGEDFPPITATEAKNLVEAKGVTITGDPQLVFRPLRENSVETVPFWEVRTTGGTAFYVIRILGVTKVYRADDVHPID